MKKLLIILLGPIILSMSPKDGMTDVASADYSKLKKLNPKTTEAGRFNIAPVSGSLIAPSFEDITIYRLQLRTFTCDREDAGTDHGVYVQMNERDDRFYLNKGTDDFRQKHSDTYDILSEQIKKIGDIKFLKIGLRGDDAVCINKIELFINNNN